MTATRSPALRPLECRPAHVSDALDSTADPDQYTPTHTDPTTCPDQDMPTEASKQPYKARFPP